MHHQVAAEYIPVMSMIKNELIHDLRDIDNAEVRGDLVQSDIGAFMESPAVLMLPSCL